MHFDILVYKGEQGKGEWSGAKASRVRASGPRPSEGRVSKARWRRGTLERVTSKDSLFHHHPNFYDFFPRAIAPLLVPCICFLTMLPVGIYVIY